MSKNYRFQTPFDKEHGKRFQTILKSARQHLFHIYWSLWRKLSFKKSLLLICKILGLFANRLTAEDKYFPFSTDDLMQPIQMQLFQEQKTFSPFFSAFFKSGSNFEHFQNTDDHDDLYLSEMGDCGRRG